MKAEEEKDAQRLRDRLLEDTGSLEEARQLLPTARRLQAWPSPHQPTAAETERLVARLKAELPTPDYQLPIPNIQSPIPNLQSSWLLLRAQARVVRREIWAASALVMALGTLVTLATYGPYSSGETLPFVLVAPIVAAIGVAFFYGPAVDPALEIELATPVSPRLVLLARLALVSGFDLGLGLAGSATLSLLRADLSFWPLVSAWLAPMAFLSALAFLLTVLSTDPGAGVLVSLGLWAVQSVGRMTARSGTSWPVPDLTAEAAHPWLWTLALLLGALALWIGGQEERWLRGQA